MKKNILLLCIVMVMTFLAGCGKHIEGFRLNLQDMDDGIETETLKSYEECINMDFDTEKTAEIFSLPEDEIYFGEGSIYYQAKNFQLSNYSINESVNDEENKIVAEFTERYREKLKELGIAVCEEYDSSSMLSDNGDRVYGIKMYQKCNELKIYDGTHGTIKNRSIVYGPGISIYFRRDKILLLEIQAVSINSEKYKEEKIVKKADILDAVANTYGKIKSSDTYTLKGMELQYAVFKEKQGGTSLCPVWVIVIEIINKEGDAYDIVLVYNGVTGKEVI